MIPDLFQFAVFEFDRRSGPEADPLRGGLVAETGCRKPGQAFAFRAGVGDVVRHITRREEGYVQPEGLKRGRLEQNAARSGAFDGPPAGQNAVDREVAVVLGLGRIRLRFGGRGGRKILVPGKAPVFRVKFGFGKFRVRVPVRLVDRGENRNGRIAGDGDVAVFAADEALQLDGAEFAAQVVMLEFDGEDAGRDVEILAHDADHARVPVQPDRAARPGAGPRLAVRGLHQLGVLTEKIDSRFEEGHLRLAAALGLLAGPVPEIEHFAERLDVGRMFFADANVPHVVLADVDAQGIRAHRDAYADVPIAEQEALEEVRRGLGSGEAVPPGDRGGIQRGETALGRWGGERCSRGCGRFQKSAPGGSHLEGPCSFRIPYPNSGWAARHTER